MRPIRSRLVDPAFDLASWLSAQRPAGGDGGPLSPASGLGLVASAAVPVDQGPPSLSLTTALEADTSTDELKRSAGDQADAVLVGPSGKSPLAAAITSIGRDRDNDVAVPHPDVSGLHAQIVRVEGTGLYLYDMGSASGTLVNGERVYAPHPLADGDRITIGGVNYTFRLGQSDQTISEGSRAAAGDRTG